MRRGTAIGVLGLALGLTFAPDVFAADAYLCGTNEVVYVEIEDLEAAKRTNPCIASYYKTTIIPKTVVGDRPAIPAAPIKTKLAQPAKAKPMKAAPIAIPTAAPASPATLPAEAAGTSGGMMPIRIINASGNP